MRQKRAKSYRKQMLVYHHTYKFREPYQVIVDDQLVLDCDKSSFDLKKGLARTLQAEVKPMITQCCVQELYKTKNQSAIDLAKTLERRRCNHPPSDPIPPEECIKSIVNINGENKHRYVVATEHDNLRRSLRRVPGVPLIHMKRSVMIMEPLSVASAKISSRMEKSKLTKGLNDVTGGIQKPVSSDESKPIKKKKGPKEPNPLSIKKKRTENDIEDKSSAQQKKKRRRKHQKINQDDKAIENITNPTDVAQNDEENSPEIDD